MYVCDQISFYCVACNLQVLEPCNLSHQCEAPSNVSLDLVDSRYPVFLETIIIKGFKACNKFKV